MMVPEFVRFYGYTVEQAFKEYAKTFYALVNAMYQLQAQEALMSARGVAAGNGSTETVAGLEKQAQGLGAIVREVETIKGK